MSANVPPMSQPEGIDVAYPHAPSYDWRQWRGKISFGVCEVTEGLTITGPTFVSDRNAMRELNHMMPLARRPEARTGLG